MDRLIACRDHPAPLFETENIGAICVNAFSADHILHLPIEKVLEIAEGRVWIGTEAQKIGLVDTCGGLTAALAIAVDKADLGDGYQIVEIKEEAKGFMAILQSLNVSVREKITARSELGQLYAE